TAVGKGTVSAAIRARYPEIWLSVSATTRPPRPGEVDGVHYRFVSEEEFTSLVESGQMLEWAVVHGCNKYGTPPGPVEQKVAAGVEPGAEDGLVVPLANHAVAVAADALAFLLGVRALA